MNATYSSLPATSPDFDADYWSQRFPSEPYLTEGDRFEDFEPVLRFGHALRAEIEDFDSQEPECREKWAHAKAGSPLTWERAKPVARAAWLHAHESVENSINPVESFLSRKFEEFEGKVRRQPVESIVLGSAAGYLAAWIPLRSVFFGMGFATTMVLGLSKAGELLRRTGK